MWNLLALCKDKMKMKCPGLGLQHSTRNADGEEVHVRFHSFFSASLFIILGTILNKDLFVATNRFTLPGVHAIQSSSSSAPEMSKKVPGGQGSGISVPLGQ